jgi:hypothetical protein
LAPLLIQTALPRLSRVPLDATRSARAARASVRAWKAQLTLVQIATAACGAGHTNTTRRLSSVQPTAVGARVCVSPRASQCIVFVPRVHELIVQPSVQELSRGFQFLIHSVLDVAS